MSENNNSAQPTDGFLLSIDQDKRVREAVKEASDILTELANSLGAEIGFAQTGVVLATHLESMSISFLLMGHLRSGLMPDIEWWRTRCRPIQDEMIQSIFARLKATQASN